MYCPWFQFFFEFSHKALCVSTHGANSLEKGNISSLQIRCSKESPFLIVRSSKVSFPSRTDPVDLDHFIYVRSP